MRYILLILFAVSGFGQEASSRPNFSDYLAVSIFSGIPAPPRMEKDQLRFRTKIRLGAKSKVEFAGHYTVPAFGCGSGCTMFYIVDSVSGKVYDGLAVLELPGDWQEKFGVVLNRVDYHPESRLMKISGCPNETNCGFFDYLMVDGKGMTLLRKQLLPKQYQYQ